MATKLSVALIDIMTISKIYSPYRFWMCFTLLVIAWVASYVGTDLVLKFLGIAEQAFSNLIINSVFLLTCVGCIRLFGLSAEDVGLKIIRERVALHVGLCLMIFTLYWQYYLFVVRISSLRPVTSNTMWGLLNYLVVAFAEEVCYRGLFYHIIAGRTSGRVAVLVSGLLFGLVHFRQGMGMVPRFFTGWLWGSVRYATGMISLLILLHFTYDVVWLLFQGNWDNRTIIANLLPPFVELLVTILIVANPKTTRHPGMMFSKPND
jgi:membrane protease YdiL (CAAX protease family)